MLFSLGMPRVKSKGGGVFKILDSCCQYIKVFILDSICPPLSSQLSCIHVLPGSRSSCIHILHMYTQVYKAISPITLYTYNIVNVLSIIVYTVSLDSLRAYDDSINHDNVNSCLQVYNVINV